MKHSSQVNGKLQCKTHIYIYFFFPCFSVNKKFVLLALKLKCSGKTTRMPTQACRQPPPCRNFDKSFVKCVRTKDFVGAAPVFHMKKPAVVFVLLLLQFFEQTEPVSNKNDFYSSLFFVRTTLNGLTVIQK